MNDFDGALTKSLDDFMESYKITDTEKIYSNGMELVPIFRVKQWEEYNNKYKEIERLNNIINEFEEELKWQRKVCLSLNEKFTISRIDTLIDKLQELKDRDKE